MTRHRQLQWMIAFASILAVVIAAFAQTAARLPADLDPDSRARLPYLQRKDMDAKNQTVFDRLPGRGQDGVLRGPLAFAAYNPEAALALFDLHNAAVAGRSPRVRELAILVACRETNYSLEWNAHQAIGTQGRPRSESASSRSHDRRAHRHRREGRGGIRFGRRFPRPEDGRRPRSPRRWSSSARRGDGPGGGDDHLRRQRLLRHRRGRAHARRAPDLVPLNSTCSAFPETSIARTVRQLCSPHQSRENT